MSGTARAGAGVVLGVAVLLAMGPAPAGSAEAPAPVCSEPRYRCLTVAVPLDPAGRVPGHVALPVAIRRGAARDAAPVVLLPGGPGQAALGVARPLGDALDPALAGRDLVVFDPRGTGRAGPLRCRELERGRTRHLSLAAARCARRLGARRRLFTSRMQASDLEAIRRAIGAPRIALLATSYGTRVARAYAARYPGRVERIVLDSPVPARGPDPLRRETARALPRVLTELCRRVCIPRGRDLRAELVRVVGSREPATSRGALLELLLAGDIDRGLHLRLPAAARAALQGRPRALRRLAREAASQPDIDIADFSPAANAAALCEELAVPWDRRATPATRRRHAARAARSIPRRRLAPLDVRTLMQTDIARLCLRWPRASTARPPAPPRLPDVPLLLLSGRADVRTPLENARRIAGGRRNAWLIAVPAVGHGPMTTDRSGCAHRALRAFLEGGAPARCLA